MHGTEGGDEGHPACAVRRRVGRGEGHAPGSIAETGTELRTVCPSVMDSADITALTTDRMNVYVDRFRPELMMCSTVIGTRVMFADRKMLRSPMLIPEGR